MMMMMMMDIHSHDFTSISTIDSCTLSETVFQSKPAAVYKMPIEWDHSTRTTIWYNWKIIYNNWWSQKFNPFNLQLRYKLINYRLFFLLRFKWLYSYFDSILSLKVFSVEGNTLMFFVGFYFAKIVRQIWIGPIQLQLPCSKNAFKCINHWLFPPKHIYKKTFAFKITRFPGNPIYKSNNGKNNRKP